MPMATLASLSAPPLPSPRSLSLSSLLIKQSFSRALLQCSDRRTLPAFLKCSSSGPTQETEPESKTTPSSPPEPTTSSSSSSSSDLAYNLCLGLGGIGFLETSYLTFLKLTNSSAFCPIGGGSCSDVLNSDYAVVFGVPLPLIGMAMYGLIATLGAQLNRKSLPFGLIESDGRQILLWATTSVAASSAYFLYILGTRFTGTTCSYCILSALLSFSLLFVTVKDFGWEEIKKEVGVQLCIAGLVFVTLNSAYTASRPVPPSLDDIDLPYYSSFITTKSSPYALSLAKHLSSIGAKMYGAFWCSHCIEQKEMFGYEAAKLLNYTECFPNGFKKGTIMETECSAVGIEGFPTWVINGKVLSGILQFSELAEASGFPTETVAQSPDLVK